MKKINKNNQTKRVNLIIEKSHLLQIQELAQENNMNEHDIVNAALEDYLNNKDSRPTTNKE